MTAYVIFDVEIRYMARYQDFVMGVFSSDLTTFSDSLATLKDGGAILGANCTHRFLSARRSTKTGSFCPPKKICSGESS